MNLVKKFKKKYNYSRAKSALKSILMQAYYIHFQVIFEKRGLQCKCCSSYLYYLDGKGLHTIKYHHIA